MPTNVRRYTGVFAHAGLQRARESANAAAARRAAKLLEAAGERGDRHLVHVSDGELRSIRKAFGPGGHAGRRNPFTGLESFAPEDDNLATRTDRSFVGTNPDGSGYTIRLPREDIDPVAAGYESLRRILPTSESAQGTAPSVTEPSATLPQDSWGRVLWKGVENWPSEVQRSLGGLGRAIGEGLSSRPTVPPELGLPDATIQGYAPPAAQGLVDWSTRLHDSAVADLMANAPNVDPNSAKAFAYDIVSSFPQMAVLLASAATGTALPAIGALALQGFGSRYGDARQQGRTAAQATGDAAAHAVAASLPAAVPVGLLMRPGGSFLGRTLSQMGAGGAQGALTQAMDEAYAKGVIGTGTSWGEAWDRIKRAGLIGGAAGALVGGAQSIVGSHSTQTSTWSGTDGATQIRTKLSTGENREPGFAFGEDRLPQFQRYWQDSGGPANEAAAGYVRKMGSDTGHEHLVAIDESTGQPIAAVTSGLWDRVWPSRELHELMIDPQKQLALHHNHPDESGLSYQDVLLATEPGVSRITAHTPGGATMSAAISPGFKPTSPHYAFYVRHLITEVTRYARMGADAVLVPEIKEGRLDPAIRRQFMDDIVNETLAKIGLIDYSSNRDLSTVLSPSTREKAMRSALSWARRAGL